MADLSLDALRRAVAAPSKTIHRPEARQAGVAAVFTHQMDLLFISRAERQGDPWSGQISFPGGHHEAGDADLRETAMRESMEELGLDLSNAEVLGQLDDLGTVRHLPARVVQPWAFLVPEIAQLTPNYEVASVHRASLVDLVDGVGRGTMPLVFKGSEYTLPKVDFDGKQLWGMTLQMVDDLLNRLDGRGVGLDR